jgi:putative ABC transport system substrate-binding protein
MIVISNQLISDPLTDNPRQNKPMTARICVLFCLLMTVLLITGPAQAQQPARIPRIGYLTGSPLSSDRIEALRRGLRELGYVEGKKIVIELRSHEGKPDRQHASAAELVRLKVDVIVAVGSGDIRSAKAATATIPIVIVQGGDAVKSGFVASLARPGGNITGLATPRPELSGKSWSF